MPDIHVSTVSPIPKDWDILKPEKLQEKKILIPNVVGKCFIWPGGMFDGKSNKKSRATVPLKGLLNFLY